MGKISVLRFLETLRRPNGELMVDIYTHGGCFQLYRLLSMVFEGAKAWYDGIEGHVYTEIDGRFYDIRGEHEKSDSWLPLDDYGDGFVRKAGKWRYP